MTVENADIVDGAGISKGDGKVVLTISDHLTWENEASHFTLLEGKIDRYIDFIKSGQLISVFPISQGRSVRIEIICQYPPSELASNFLSTAKKRLKAMDIELSYYPLPEGY